MSRFDPAALLQRMRSTNTPMTATRPAQDPLASTPTASVPMTATSFAYAAPSPSMSTAIPPVDDLSVLSTDQLRDMVRSLRAQLEQHTSASATAASGEGQAKQLLEEQEQLRQVLQEEQQLREEQEAKCQALEERLRVVSVQRDEALHEVQRVKREHELELTRVDQTRDDMSAMLSKAKAAMRDVAAERDHALQKVREMGKLQDLLSKAQESFKTLMAERDMLSEALQLAQVELRSGKSALNRSGRSKSPPSTPTVQFADIPTKMTRKAPLDQGKRPAFTSAVSPNSARFAPTHEVGALHLPASRSRQKPVVTIELGPERADPPRSRSDGPVPIVVPVTLSDLMTAP